MNSIITYETLGEIKTLVAETFCHLGEPQFVDVVKAEFNPRFVSRSGDANYKKLRVRFSAPLWPRALPMQRRATIIHETCHIVAIHHALQNDKLLFSYTPHGAYWQSLMVRCGLEPRRCHNISTAGLRTNVIAYCKCKIWRITKNRATRMKNGQQYYCPSCKGPIAR